MFKVKTKLDYNMQIELTKKSMLFCLVYLILGTVGLLSYIVLGVIFENGNFDYLLVFSFPFAFGLIFYLSIKKNMQKVRKTDTENEYEFNEDHFNIVTVRNNDNIGTAKIYYKEVTKFKESQNYYFLYINIYSAFPVLKSMLNEEQKSFIREKCNKKRIKQLKRMEDENRVSSIQ